MNKKCIAVLMVLVMALSVLGIFCSRQEQNIQSLSERNAYLESENQRLEHIATQVISMHVPISFRGSLACEGWNFDDAWAVQLEVQGDLGSMSRNETINVLRVRDQFATMVSSITSRGPVTWQVGCDNSKNTCFLYVFMDSVSESAILKVLRESIIKVQMKYPQVSMVGIYYWIDKTLSSDTVRTNVCGNTDSSARPTISVNAYAPPTFNLTGIINPESACSFSCDWSISSGHLVIINVNWSSPQHPILRVEVIGGSTVHVSLDEKHKHAALMFLKTSDPLAIYVYVS